MSSPLHKLQEAGVSIWLDDLSRDRIQSGSLAALIESRAVSGVTTNPTIFAGAFANSAAYSEKLNELAKSGATAEQAIFEATTEDVRLACDVFMGVYEKTRGVDGRVSIEVEPALARQSEKTIAQAKALYQAVNRENVMIKIPATVEGLDAITAVIAAGISVNVTLIFSLKRYREVIAAFQAGIEKAQSAGKDLSKIHSVASFFVSRVDTEIDKRLEQIATDEALALRSTAAIANARLAYQLYQQEFAKPQWQKLAALGANAQRPLMASTGVKDPNLKDTLYVEQLVAKDLVNTMPEKTMEAFFDHGVIPDVKIEQGYDSAHKVLQQLAEVGVSYDDVVEQLEIEGVDKFNASWSELVATVSGALEAVK